MIKAMMVGILGLAATVTVTACGTTSPKPTTSPTSTRNRERHEKHSTNSTTKTVNVYLEIETGKMDGKADWPTFSPANVNLPAHSTVHITIEAYGDGFAGIPQGYNDVKDTVNGTITVDEETVTSVNEKKVAHTLTIPSIGLNVPIPPGTASEKYNTITFEFKTPATAQQLNWQCMAACGTELDGMGRIHEYQRVDEGQFQCSSVTLSVFRHSSSNRESRFLRCHEFSGSLVQSFAFDKQVDGCGHFVMCFVSKFHLPSNSLFQILSDYSGDTPIQRFANGGTLRDDIHAFASRSRSII